LLVSIETKARRPRALVEESFYLKSVVVFVNHNVMINGKNTSSEVNWRIRELWWSRI